MEKEIIDLDSEFLCSYKIHGEIKRRVVSQTLHTLREEVAGMKVRGNDLEGQEIDLAEDGFNSAIDQVLQVIDKHLNELAPNKD